MQMILEMIQIITGFITMITGFCLMICINTAQPFPEWFQVGMVISIITIIAWIIAGISEIKKALKPKKYGIISNEEIMRILTNDKIHK